MVCSHINHLRDPGGAVNISDDAVVLTFNQC